MAYPSLANVLSTVDPNGEILNIASVLDEKSDFAKILPMFPTNMQTHNICGDDTSLPTPTLRLANEGVAAAVGTSKQIIDAPVTMESHIEIDYKILQEARDKTAYVKRQISMHMSGHLHSAVDYFINGDFSTNPREFNGLAVRYNTLPTTPYDITDPYHTVIDGGGAGADNSSIYLVAFGEGKVHGIYPQGSKAGLQLIDRGSAKIITAIGSGFYGMAYQLVWDLGLVINDRRCVARICNIDASDLKRDASSGANLIDLFTEAKNNLEAGGAKVYAFTSRQVADYFESQVDNKANAHVIYGQDNFLNKTLPMVKGIPILAHDKIGIAEALVT